MPGIAITLRCIIFAICINMKKIASTITCSLLLAAAQAQSENNMMVTFQDLCWSPDSKVIFFSSMKVKSDYSDYKPWKWAVYKYDMALKTVTKFIDSALYVAVSPSGKQIATGKIIDGNRDIYLFDNNGKKPVRLTQGPKDEFGVTFSPDEKQIAFNDRQSGKPEIYIINTDGTGLKQVTFSHGHSSYNPSWSPDGKYIVYYFEKGDRKDQIHIMNADGTGDRNITNDTLNNYFPNWAGTNKIVYSQDKYAFTIKADGTDKKPFMNIESFYTRVSPDGKMIAYVDQKEHCIKIISFKNDLIAKIVPD